MIGLKSWTMEDKLRVPFVNCHQFMYIVISLLVLRAGCGIWLYQFLIIAYHFTFHFRFWESIWHPAAWAPKEQTVRRWHRWEDIEMDRFFSVLQTTASCCKRSKHGLEPGFVCCPTGHYSCSLLFSLYINDISTDIDSEIRLFADDCVCYREIKDTEGTLKLQKDVDQLGCWARKWGMRFQPVKCNMMQITRKMIRKIHIIQRRWTL